MSGIVEDIASKSIEKLGAAAFKEFLFVKNRNSRIKWLKEIESTIDAELRKGDPFESSDVIVSRKVEKLQGIRDKMVLLFGEQAARATQKQVMGSNHQFRLFFSSSNQLVSLFRTVKHLKSITRDIKELVTDGDALEKSIVTYSSGNQNWCTDPSEETTETSSLPLSDVFVGRDKDKEKVVGMLCNSSNNNVVAIVGAGGQGKTTLAQHVCRDDRVKGKFEERLWVSLTPKSKLKEILAKIITSATGKKPDLECGLDQLHEKVFQTVAGKKRLLVLDNVYYGDRLREDSEELSEILKQGGFWDNGGKVLITTRSKTAAKCLGVRKPHELHDLSEDDSWTLLRHYAIEEEHEKKEFDVEEIGKEIAKLCPKVPLVLKVIGRQLADRDHKSQWECFKNGLASNPALYMCQQQDKIQQILKLCYDQLDYNLKRCAAFCSLFPKGHEYHKDYMVSMWIALGFVESRDGMSLEDVGDAYVLELTRRAFFQDVGHFQAFKMHDVMHDLMRSIGKKTHQVIDSKTQNIVGGVRHVSLNMDDLNWEVLLSTVSDKRRLKSILLVSSRWNSDVQGVRLGMRLNKLVRACRMLRVLEVYGQQIEEVPSSIGELTLLRHLDLSKNPFCKLPDEITKLVHLLSLDLSKCHNLRKLPTGMAKFVNLRSLDLSDCSNLEELPSDTGKLLELRHLQVMGCNLKYMPKGIGNLTKLETLDVFVVGEKTRSSKGSKSEVEAAAKLEELGHLNNLQGGLHIYVRQHSKDISSEAGEAHLEKKTQLTELRVIFETRAEEDETFLERLRPSGNKMWRLWIQNYGGKKLPKWITDDQLDQRFPKLQRMFLFCCETKMKNPIARMPIFSTPYRGYGSRPHLLKIKVDSREGDMLDQWVGKGYSRLRKKLEMGSVEVEFIPGNFRVKSLGMGMEEMEFAPHSTNGLIQKDFSDLAAPQITSLLIEKKLVPRSVPRSVRQPQYTDDVLLKSYFSNLKRLTLSDIPELEVVPEEVRNFSSLYALCIKDCPKLKGIPDWIHSLSSLRFMYITNAPEMKALPDSIGSLTMLEFWGCSGLESLPHQMSNLKWLSIYGCSKALFEKCRKPTGEYWPRLQHLPRLHISSSEGDKFHI